MLNGKTVWHKSSTTKLSSVWREPWSSAYGRRLVSKRLWVCIPLVGHFYKLTCCKNCNFGLKRLKINEKEAGNGPFLYKKLSSVNWTELLTTLMIFKMPVGDLKAEMLIDAAPMMMMTMMLMTIELLQLLLFNFVGTTFVAFLDASYSMSRCRLILCRLFDSRKRFGCGGRGEGAT